MSKIQRIRERVPKRVLWHIGLLVAVGGVFAITIGFGVGASTQARAKTTMAEKTSTIASTSNTPSDYSGGHLMAADPNGGYWTTTWLGAITSHDAAPVFGSPALSGVRLSKPIVGMAATTDGGGYWLVAADGGIFSYGDAKFYGSTGATHLNHPIVGMASTPDGGGYWLVAADGGIFSYGDAMFYGSLGGGGKTVLGIIIRPPTLGYILVQTDGTTTVMPSPSTTTDAGPPSSTTAPSATTTPAAPGAATTWPRRPTRSWSCPR